MRNKVNIDQLAIKAVEDKLEIEFPPTICITNEQIKAFGIELFKQGYRKQEPQIASTTIYLDQKNRAIEEYKKECIRLSNRINELKIALHEIGSLHQICIGGNDNHNKQVRNIVDKAQMSVKCDKVDLKQLRLNSVKYTPAMIDQIMCWYNGCVERIEKGEFELHDSAVSRLATLYQVSKEAIIEARDFTWKSGEFNNPEN